MSYCRMTLQPQLHDIWARQQFLTSMHIMNVPLAAGMPTYSISICWTAAYVNESNQLQQ